MALRSDRFGVDVPTDFPIASLEAVHAAVSDPDDERRELRQRPAWGEWAGACNGVLYRYIAFADHSDKLVDSLAVSTGPPMPERAKQERWLFNFFSEGQSALECLYYGAYFVASLADPTTVPESIDPKQITPKYVQRVFSDSFTKEPLTAKLMTVRESTDLDAWTTVRNILTHRSAPLRHHELHGGSHWLGEALRPSEFSRRRAWLAASLGDILVGLEGFATAHLT